MGRYRITFLGGPCDRPIRPGAECENDNNVVEHAKRLLSKRENGVMPRHLRTCRNDDDRRATRDVASRARHAVRWTDPVKTSGIVCPHEDRNAIILLRYVHVVFFFFLNRPLSRTFIMLDS